jgi:hypothetical protein
VSVTFGVYERKVQDMKEYLYRYDVFLDIQKKKKIVYCDTKLFEVNGVEKWDRTLCSKEYRNVQSKCTVRHAVKNIAMYIPYARYVTQ